MWIFKYVVSHSSYSHNGECEIIGQNVKDFLVFVVREDITKKATFLTLQWCSGS